ncbi:sigma-54 interaction domain-containing protein [Geosporobacter ferrireducens]|uniref:Sigma-54-dependent Fis family transcriptional regulator n=1 Tax=Geosporobacter ferrireducens TaxID=1424294 RepID=A0A1D8GF17_9FIRM|nr:sigma 54-interacting transcriptional regulator [Geosporobacter ferrireducens]AOT69488.1 hypothetical protein Gferi_07830 [Geosporobacter ferrireducens]
MNEDNKRLAQLQEELFKLNIKLHEFQNRNNLFERILDQIDEAIYAYDQSGHLIYMNRASEKVEGQTRDMLVGKKEKDIWDTNVVLPLIQGKKPIENERMYYTIPSGKTVHIVHSMYPYSQDDEVMGCFSITKDVTKMDDMIMHIYELQQQLRKSKKVNIPINGTRYSLEDIIGETPAIELCVENAYRVAKHKSNIMLYGETGTGKELFAQGIHNAGNDYNESFIGVNCSAIPSNLLESILFGTVKGAFTGATETPGLFEQVREGTLFLDEINSMPIDMQAKLLRVLQEKKYRRIGDLKDREVKCRVISSTNIEPDKAIALGQLRQDLYYRIATVTIRIPPLRERIEDINLLIYYFMNKYNTVFDTQFEAVDDKLLEACLRYHWPGNVRELEHMVESALNLSNSYEKVLLLDFFPILINNQMISTQKQVIKPHCVDDAKQIDLNEELNHYERQLILNALISNKGNIAATARQLSLHRGVLYNKLKKLDMNLEQLTEYVLK